MEVSSDESAAVRIASGDHLLTPYAPRTRPRRSQARAQRLTIVYGIICFVLVLVIGQLWLLTATLNAFLGGDGGAAVPALAASAGCLALNLGLLRYLR
jgi:hypothetical protein